MTKTALIHFNHSMINGLVGWPDMRTSSWKPNYGDMLVCAAILNQVKLADYERVNFGYKVTTDVSAAIMRGSTYLSSEFDFEAAIKTIDSVDCNIACVGLGAQSPKLDITFLDNNPNAKTFIKKLEEKSKSISVRGNFSAAVVARLGAKNIRVTGCPSAFYFCRQNPVEVQETLKIPFRRLGISIHSGLGNPIYCRDPRLTKLLHGKVIRHAVENSSSVQLFEQGVAEEFLLTDRSEDFSKRKAAAASFLKKVGLDGVYEPERIICYFSSVRSIEDWLGKGRELDAAIGFRFHGNMVALNQGVPCFYYVYDSRLQEFCELYSLPFQLVENDWIDPIKDMLDHDWVQANAAISRCKNELVSFYEENGVPHNIV